MSAKNTFFKSLRRIARRAVEDDPRIPEKDRIAATKMLYKYLRKQFEQARKDNESKRD